MMPMAMENWTARSVMRRGMPIEIARKSVVGETKMIATGVKIVLIVTIVRKVNRASADRETLTSAVRRVNVGRVILAGKAIAEGPHQQEEIAGQVVVERLAVAAVAGHADSKRPRCVNPSRIKNRRHVLRVPPVLIAIAGSVLFCEACQTNILRDESHDLKRSLTILINMCPGD